MHRKQETVESFEQSPFCMVSGENKPGTRQEKRPVCKWASLMVPVIWALRWWAVGTEEQITSHAISFAFIFLQNKYSITAFSRTDSPSGSMVKAQCWLQLKPPLNSKYLFISSLSSSNMFGILLSPEMQNCIKCAPCTGLTGWLRGWDQDLSRLTFKLYRQGQVHLCSARCPSVIKPCDTVAAVETWAGCWAGR